MTVKSVAAGVMSYGSLMAHNPDAYQKMHDSDSTLTFTAEAAQVVVDIGAGGRLTSIEIDGAELLWNELDDPLSPDPVLWGCYPMVPFAGRIRHGQFTFDGTDYEIPKCFGDHSMHGYGFRNPWKQIDDDTILYNLAEPWPFAGRVTQRFDLSPTELVVTMTVQATERQPVMFGWHPWFRRENIAGTLEVEFAAESMYRRDVDGMPGELASPPPPGPWDDCFVGIASPPVLRWGELAVELSSSLDHWVVFDEPEHAACVEAQSGPPNEINTGPRIVEAGESFSGTFTLRFG